MTPPLSDRAESDFMNPAYKHVLSQFQGDLSERLNVEQMFILIDGVLSFEACLYHQILPLYVEGSRLTLGMVSPDDAGAADYVRRIISYLNYSLVMRPISSGALQTSLSAYLNYVSGKRAAAPTAIPAKTSPHPDPADQDFSWSTPVNPELDASTRQTFILDDSSELEASAEDEAIDLEPSEAPIVDEPLSELSEPSSEPFSEPASFPEAASPFRFGDVPDSEDLTEIQVADERPLTGPSQSPLPLDEQPSFLTGIPVLRIQTNHSASPIESLLRLPASELLQELLGRVLERGIGRLYFERQTQIGRVLWSQNGVLQSILEKVEVPQFQALLNELKLLAHMPALPVQQPQQGEVERLYQKERILLRFRLMPGLYGEEGTLQVLRGAALKFYQQQQLVKLGRDAITIAKQLQYKIDEIRSRSLSEPGLLQGRLSALANLRQLLTTIEEQIEDLQDVQDVQTQTNLPHQSEP